jgi:outer membrane beta-barrel protein
VNRVPTFILAFLVFLAAQYGNAAEYSEVEFPYGRSEITLYAGGFLGDSFIIRPAPLFDEVEAVFNDDVTIGFRYGYYFHPNLAFEGGIGFTPASILGRADVSGGTNASAIFDVNTYVLHANIVYSFIANGSIVPYVTAGVGGVHFDINTARFGFLTPSETDFAFNAGGGVKFRLHEEYFLRLDGRVYWMDPEFAEEDGTATFTEITGGISVLFDF